MRFLLIPLFVFILGSPSIAPLVAQSEKDCQAASKLHAEQELIQALFANLGTQTHAEGGPALGSDPSSLQSKVRAAISSCQTNGGNSDACGNYKRIRDAWLINNAGGSPGAAMVTDPQTCEVLDPDTGESIDPARDRPSGGFERADWDSQYEHEKFHQNNCRRLNGPGANYQSGGPPSPYLQQMSDPRELAKEEGFAHGITGDILEDYLKDNCFDPDLFVNAEDMAGKCGESPSALTKIKSLAQQVKSWVVNTPNDWLSIPTTGPVTTQPGGETEVNMRGDCQCCDGTTKSGEVRVYGGPGHSILVGTDATNMGCAKNKKCAGMSGDPHLRTYDGLRFDFQGAGEFVLARGDGFEVQARLQPYSRRPITLTKALVIQINGDVVSMYAGKPRKLFVLGVETALQVGASIQLPGGGVLTREQLRYRLTSPLGIVSELQGNTHLAIKIGLPPGTRSVGLLGNFDEDTTNDLRSATGTVLPQPIAFETLYKVFGAGWRVTEETSLFDYAEGQSVDTFYDPTFPQERVEAREIRGEARRKAESACRKAGVTGAINLDDCILDVGLTGEVEFAEIAATQPLDETRLEIRGTSSESQPSGPKESAAPAPSVSAGGVSFDAPAEAFGSHSVEIGLNGPIQRGYSIAIAPVGSDAYGRAVNPYSERGLNGKKTTVKLIVPIIPGDYELRYLDNSRPRNILLRQPFRSLEPKVDIDAPVSGAAGEPFDVRVTGNVGEHMYVAIVPLGSPNETQGRWRGPIKQGSEYVSRIRKLPDERGRYEIRCSSFWGREQRRIHARRPLTVH